MPTVAAASAGKAMGKELQLRIFHELTEMTLGKTSIADVLQLVVEGVYRGVGCERVLVALLSEDRLVLQGRVALGPGADALCARFVFSMDGDPDDVVDAAIDSGQACRIHAGRLDGPGLERLLQITACDEAFLVPFGTATRQIGVLYADRNGKQTDEESWRAIRHFALQATLAVSMRSDA